MKYVVLLTYAATAVFIVLLAAAITERYPALDLGMRPASAASKTAAPAVKTIAIPKQEKLVSASWHCYASFSCAPTPLTREREPGDRYRTYTICHPDNSVCYRFVEEP